MEIAHCNNDNKFNPSPATKLLSLLLLGLNAIYISSEICNALIVLLFCIFFVLNNKKEKAVKALVLYIVLILITKNRIEVNHGIIFICFSIIFLMKMFFLPFLAANFLISTSSVSDIISSLEKIKLPVAITIPIAVMFRYFPAFKEEHKNIKLAMKMRKLNFLNPIKYFEYILIPILISAINIADDIAKSAETKCISDPCKKTRYFQVKYRLIDIIFFFLVLSLYILGRIYA